MCVTKCFRYLCMKSSNMNIEKFKHIVQKYLQGKISDKEKNILQKFENQMIDKNISEAFSSEEEIKQIQKEISDKVFRSVSKKKTIVWQKWAIAASFLLLFGIGILYILMRKDFEGLITSEKNIAEIEITTQKNERQEVTLSDGTKVMLSPESTLRYPTEFSTEIRKVFLSGEAYFDVVRNEQQPFVVISKNIETQVLGTSFNVRAYDGQEQIKVTLASGKVRVSDAKNQIILSPSQQLVYEKSSQMMTLKNIDLEDFAQMRNGILRFEEMTLRQVVEKLEDFYNVRISLQVQNSEKYYVTGVFKKEDIRVILEQICFVHQGITYEKITDKHIVIKGMCN